MATFGTKASYSYHYTYGLRDMRKTIFVIHVIVRKIIRSLLLVSKTYNFCFVIYSFGYIRQNKSTSGIVGESILFISDNGGRHILIFLTHFYKIHFHIFFWKRHNFVENEQIWMNQNLFSRWRFKLYGKYRHLHVLSLVCL